MIRKGKTDYIIFQFLKFEELALSCFAEINYLKACCYHRRLLLGIFLTFLKKTI